jgi:hypothetical protein
MKHVDIAKQMNISPVTVSIACNSAVAQDYRKHLRAEREEAIVKSNHKLSTMAERATEVLEEVMDGSDFPASVRLRAAESVLNRLGVDTPKKVEHDVTDKRIVDDKLLKQMKETAMQTARECGLIQTIEVASSEVGA